MTSEQFVYWLQGFLELSEANEDRGKMLNPAQVQMVKDHLKLVLEKRTPVVTTTHAPNTVTLPYVVPPGQELFPGHQPSVC